MEEKSQRLTEVLIAGADPAQLTRIRESVEKAGCVVVEAANGEDALAQFKTREPDAVLLNAALPGMDGFEVCRAIRQTPAGQHKPILMVIGGERVEAIRRAYEAGASDFITSSAKGFVLDYRIQFMLRTAKASQKQEKLALASRVAEPVDWPRDFHHKHQSQPVEIAGTLQDVMDSMPTGTALRESEALLIHLAYHDALTGLPNRLLFQNRFQHAIAKAHRSCKQVAILFMDLDQFKRVNDSFGHDVGDRLLQAVAGRLRACTRKGNTLARIGGDEFVLLLEEVEQLGAVCSMAHKVNTCLAPAFRVGGLEFHVTASIGIGIYPDDGGSVAELMRCADFAMYRAKEGGGSSFQFFTQGMPWSVNSKA
ncbi:hypothetical protein DESUT3_41090 [Desulfuromonas versatilis]|uniref:Response regulator receiver modulated diguanylate cyclase n=1 Tax=Desulfuromonas versatilis TaxID=2802975 RepID=A0ABN6E3V2_9BACT|nr:diguanylate cyclase [Desulfuromonas versatilis]BCR07040.1 hypothetical protein DESUT3_41090 [Desulfuromonas versatilis]